MDLSPEIEVTMPLSSFLLLRSFSMAYQCLVLSGLCLRKELLAADGLHLCDVLAALSQLRRIFDLSSLLAQLELQELLASIADRFLDFGERKFSDFFYLHVREFPLGSIHVLTHNKACFERKFGVCQTHRFTSNR